MKKPKTLKKLYELLHPKDLLEVLDFSGINDKKGTEHYKIKREFSKIVWNSVYYISRFGKTKEYHCKNPQGIYTKIPESYYSSVIKCIQDFYVWSHWDSGYNHLYKPIYKRVINALEIPIEKIKEIYCNYPKNENE